MSARGGKRSQNERGSREAAVQQEEKRSDREVKWRLWETRGDESGTIACVARSAMRWCAVWVRVHAVGCTRVCGGNVN